MIPWQAVPSQLLQFQLERKTACHVVIRKHAEGETPPKFDSHATKKSKSKIQINKFLQRLCGPDLYKTAKYTFH